jgi:hypothetical protein
MPARRPRRRDLARANTARIHPSFYARLNPGRHRRRRSGSGHTTQPAHITNKQTANAEKNGSRRRRPGASLYVGQSLLGEGAPAPLVPNWLCAGEKSPSCFCACGLNSARRTQITISRVFRSDRSLELARHRTTAAADLRTAGVLVVRRAAGGPAGADLGSAGR